MSSSITRQSTVAFLQEQLVQAQKEQAALLSMGNRIAAARHRQNLWDIVTDEILALFGSKYYVLYLLEKDGKTCFSFLYSPEKTILSRTHISPISHESLPVADGVFDAVLAADKPLIFQLSKLIRQKNIPAYIIHWFNAGIQEMVAIKMVNGNEAKGVLFFYAAQPNTFSTTQFDVLLGVCNLIGTGVSNILANEKLEQQSVEMDQYKKQAAQDKLYLQQEHSSIYPLPEIISSNPEMQAVAQLITQVAAADTTVLVLGETGTGKELIATAIHTQSSRQENRMIKVNCAALPANLIESELFGHEKGSFTGATDRRIGKFELANNSTLFLDEIGEMPLEAQAKLLRALQEKEIERIGGKNSIKVNVRIVAATNRHLEKEVAEGRFRSDLYYRLNVFPIELPPLRNRKSDIPALAQYFLLRFAKIMGRKVTGISAKALDGLMTYTFPGNVRELEHLIERAVILSEGPVISHIQFPQSKKAVNVSTGKELIIQPLADMEREYILAIIKACNGRIFGENGAAAQLKIPGTTLASKMQKLGIRKEHFAEK